MAGIERREIWLCYPRVLVAGLAFQLGAGIVGRSVTNDWEAVGRIGAVAMPPTFLNCFLERGLTEIRESQHGRAVERTKQSKGA